MDCPSCNAPLGWQAKFSQLVVCRYCQTASHVDREAVRIAGKMSALAHTPGPLYLDGTGLWQGHRFTTIGRVRYGYELGFWDEWLLAFEDGKQRWVGEDGDEFTMTHIKTHPDAERLWARAAPGQRVSLGERSYHVDEKGVARCMGGEGQLPFVVEEGEQTRYFDLSSGDKRVATVELDDEGHARVFEGVRLDPADLHMDMPLDESQKAAMASRLAGEEAKQEFVQVTGTDGAALSCMTCGAPLPQQDGLGVLQCEYCGTDNDSTLPHGACPSCQTHFVIPGGDTVAFYACPKCHQHVDCSGGAPQARGVAAAADTAQLHTTFKVGQRCQLRGVEYVVTGHIRTASYDEGTPYNSDEYFLYHPETGYRLLEEEAGHFTFSRQVPDLEVDVPPYVKTSFTYEGRKYKVFEHNSSTVIWVTGQLPYVATVGDSSRFTDAISPPHLISKSESDREVEYYVGEYVPRSEIARAFGVEESELPAKIGIGACQPQISSPTRKAARWVVAVLGLLNAILLVWGCAQGREVGNFQVGKEVAEGEYFTEPFTVTKDNAICEVEFAAALDNQWMYLDVAVVDDKNVAVQEFSAEWEYYSGVEGGESWSEGSQSALVPFKLRDPGDYRLLLKEQASVPMHLTVRITENVVLTRYFLMLFLACVGYLGVEMVIRHAFEAKRWGEEDDDD